MPHRVENQPPPLADYNLWQANPLLREAVQREGAGWAEARLNDYGMQLGTADMQEQAALANRHSPVLQTHDRFGHRIDRVDFHPAWHRLMAAGVSAGLHSSPWADPRSGAHVARAAAFMLHAEVENGTLCPLSMTYGSASSFAQAPQLAAQWLPAIFTREYDSRFRPVQGKRGALIGMGMTEKQGGSDVRANTTVAAPAGDGSWRLRGHKWFTSAPMCDGFFVTAKTAADAAGVSCFFMPRFLPDGSRNDIRIQRLKDKLGNRSNASAELEFEGTQAWLVGEEGRGIPTILQMGVFTRLDCSLGSTGIMHQCVAQAVHHARHRRAFGRRLIEQPLMRNVLADLALEVEGAVALSMRLARAYDRTGDEAEMELRRVLTGVCKYWICRRGPALGFEAMETLGGNGYVEEAPLARFYRELPVNSIWEGSGNIMCLDVLRALGRSPGAVEAIVQVLQPARGSNSIFDAFCDRLVARFRSSQLQEQLQEQLESQARRLASDIALAVSAAILLQASAEIGDLFCRSRLDGPAGSGMTFGNLPEHPAMPTLIERALPTIG
ncbi:MAG: isovaleryl-CoA dehydrogenase [Lautropia sp.]|nr:isovaleryl-CoA dehydrogenase [Lautropia sp.]